MVEAREERRRIAARDKELIGEMKSLETELITRLDEQGMKKASGEAGTASITEQILPQVVDWDALYTHIHETESYFLLQRRPAAAAFRELHASGEEVPGIEPFTQRTISLRKS